MTERIKYFRTHAVTKSFENASIYPAHAGINREPVEVRFERDDLPRTRGDKPNEITESITFDKSTPHTRG